jgi:hypothetical protein
MNFVDVEPKIGDKLTFALFVYSTARVQFFHFNEQ